MYLEKNYQTYKAFLEGSVQNLLLVGSFFFLKRNLRFSQFYMYMYVNAYRKGQKGKCIGVLWISWILEELFYYFVSMCQ